MAGKVGWPLASNVIRGGKLSNTFGMVRKYADGKPKPHQGWDLKAKVGTAARAVADGKVAFVRNVGAYGLQACIAFTFDEQPLYAFYAHMQHLQVKAGQDVQKGQIIGTCGKSGNASNLSAAEEHLHFEIRTVAECGLGLAGRISPLNVFGACPLKNPVAG